MRRSLKKWITADLHFLEEKRFTTMVLGQGSVAGCHWTILWSFYKIAFVQGAHFKRSSWNYAGSFAATWRMQGKAGLLGPFERER